MHPTADTTALIFGNRSWRRVMPGVRLLHLTSGAMNSFLGVVKYGCWVMGAAGLLGAYGLYSFPAHLDLSILLAMAGASAALIAIGFIVRRRQKAGFQ